MDLSGAAALITGGRRIGSVVATELARAGADVSLVYHRGREQADRTASDVTASGRRALVLQADLRDPAACARVVDETASAFGRLDVVVNMASVYKRTPAEELSVADWDEQFNVDVRSAWLCAKAAVPWMIRGGRGRIINFSDWAARSGRPKSEGYLAYHAAKSAVIGLTEALALELAPHQILVNAIAPGPILPPEDLSAADTASDAQAAAVGHWGGSMEIAKLVLALIESDFITGETIRVDGGRHIK